MPRDLLPGFWLVIVRIAYRRWQYTTVVRIDTAYRSTPQHTAVLFFWRQKRNKIHGKVAAKMALVLTHVYKWFLVLLHRLWRFAVFRAYCGKRRPTQVDWVAPLWPVYRSPPLWTTKMQKIHGKVAAQAVYVFIHVEHRFLVL